MEFPQNQEIWRAVDGYKNYEVSNHGRVRNAKTGKLLKQTMQSGRFAVGLCKGGKKIDMRVHRLVAVAFIPNPDSLPVVDHINRNAENNHVENLRWCSQMQNSANQTIRTTNKTGLKGVYLEKHCSKYRAVIKHNYKKHHIGYFDTAEEAGRAYKKKPKSYLESLPI